MSAVIWILVVVVVAVIAVAAAITARNARHRNKLRERFGPEYDRAVEQSGDRRAAEHHLSEVADRRDTLNIRDLTEDERAAFTERWVTVQSEFVDQPTVAARHAEELIAEVMQIRGYPTDDDDDERTDLLTADHPEVVASYREAQALRAGTSTGVTSTGGEGDGGDTEALRGAVVRYRILFEELVGVSSAKPDRPSTAAHDSTDAEPSATVGSPTERSGSTEPTGSTGTVDSSEPTVRGEEAVPVAAHRGAHDPR
ncbi:MAG: hypothetical protein ACQSGP_10490 [Frankia sp.]